MRLFRRPRDASPRQQPLSRWAAPDEAAITATVHVADVARAVAFYQELGFALERTVASARGGLASAVLTFGDSRVLIYRATPAAPGEEERGGRARGPEAGARELTVHVPNAAELLATFASLGIAPSTDLERAPGGARAFSLKDPFGVRWTFATQTGAQGRGGW